MATREQFFDFSTAKLKEIISQMGRPRLGVLVPDGSRRLVLAYSDIPPGTVEFYQAAARLPAQYLLEAICIFFNYELPCLLVPILGRSILRRGSDYQQHTLLEGLRLLFNSPEWLALYTDHQVRVRVYGHPECLKDTACEPALQWIDQVVASTSSHEKHTLYYGIGEAPIVGQEAGWNAIQFYIQHGRQPTLEEQIIAYYGTLLPPADFFIMTSKMSGLGALPNLLVNGDTEAYFLPTIRGMTEETYRLILYDLLYDRAALRAGISDFEISPASRLALRQVYEQTSRQVIGIGSSIGKVWFPDQDCSHE